MSLAALIPILLKSSVFAIVFALGLRVTLGDLTWLLRHPRALVRCVLAMFVIMPLVAAGLAGAFEFAPAVKLALVALALSPVPPVLPEKEVKAGGEKSKAVGLLFAVSMLSVLVVPLGIDVIGRWFGLDFAVPVSSVVETVGLSVIVPLVAGLVVRAVAPRIARRIADPINGIGGVVLLVAILPILVGAAPAMWGLVGNGTLLAITTFTVVGLLVGHFLAGERAADRTVLALSTASRHPGIALVIAGSVAPELREVAPAVLLYLLVSTLLSGIYLAIRSKEAPAEAAVSPEGAAHG